MRELSLRGASLGEEAITHPHFLGPLVYREGYRPFKPREGVQLPRGLLIVDRSVLLGEQMVSKAMAQGSNPCAPADGVRGVMVQHATL